MNLLILRTVSRVHLFLMTLFAVYLLLRGHNEPGGGFIAGLLTAAAIVLQAVAFDVRYAERLVPIRESYLIAGGLTLAVGTGIVPTLFGAPLLDQVFGHFDLPFFGHVELATALIFDLGVYFVVVGVSKWIILTIAEEMGLGLSPEPDPVTAVEPIESGDASEKL